MTPFTPCRDYAELFHAPENEHYIARAHRVAKAKALCEGCPFKAPCKTQGDADPDQYAYAIYAGESPEERGVGSAKAAREARAAQRTAPCGTPPAYKRHIKNGEDPCQACIDAAHRQHLPHNEKRKASA